MFSDVIRHVVKHKCFRKISKSALEAFALDISFVALSIRTGYLVDTFQLSEQEIVSIFSSLLEELRMISNDFKNIIHLYEPATNQSFFVNTNLLLQKIPRVVTREDDSATLLPAFISLRESGGPHKLSNTPSNLILLLKRLRDEFQLLNEDGATAQLPLSVSLPSNLPCTASIPLAAILLDYPVAYVPTSTQQTSFLSNVPLVLYRCILAFPGAEVAQRWHQRILLQFTCPEVVKNQPNDQLSIANLISHLEDTFCARAEQHKATLKVEWKRIVLDRVAL